MAVIFIFFFFLILNCCFVLTHKLSACFAVKSQPFLRYDLKFFDVFVRLFEYMNASYFNTQLHDKTISSVLFSDCNESKVKILYPYFKNQIFTKLQGFLFYFLLMHKIRAQQLLVLTKKQKLKETISVYVLQKQYVGLA